MSLFQDQLLEVLRSIEAQGGSGMAVFVAVYVAACILFIPGSLLTLGAGAIYGVILGTMVVSVASVAGASAAFLLGRYLLRGWIAKKLDARPKFKELDRAVEREGWKIVFLSRLSPIFPFVFLNYAYGLTKVSFTGYVLASWIGMLPGTILYVYLGSVAGSLAAIGTVSDMDEGSTAKMAITGLALFATIAVTVFVSRLARKALQTKVGE